MKQSGAIRQRNRFLVVGALGLAVLLTVISYGWSLTWAVSSCSDTAPGTTPGTVPQTVPSTTVATAVSNAFLQVLDVNDDLAAATVNLNVGDTFTFKARACENDGSTIPAADVGFTWAVTGGGNLSTATGNTTVYSATTQGGPFWWEPARSRRRSISAASSTRPFSRIGF